MSTLWGPALDAEISYRRERLTAAARGRRRTGAGERASRLAADAVARAATAARAVVPAAAPACGGATRRGWRLRGSGAWHAAR